MMPAATGRAWCRCWAATCCYALEQTNGNTACNDQSAATCRLGNHFRVLCLCCRVRALTCPLRSIPGCHVEHRSYRGHPPHRHQCAAHPHHRPLPRLRPSAHWLPLALTVHPVRPHSADRSECMPHYVCLAAVSRSSSVRLWALMPLRSWPRRTTQRAMDELTIVPLRTRLTTMSFHATSSAHQPSPSRFALADLSLLSCLLTAGFPFPGSWTHLHACHTVLRAGGRSS